MRRALLSSLFSVIFASGCTLKEIGNSASDGRRSPTTAGPAETAYCSTSSSYGGGVTITGTAKYNRRVITEGGTSEGLGSASPTHLTRPAEVRPIRAAEIRVTDAAGSVIQCGQTSSTGTFSIVLPAGNTNYTLSVNSRSAQFNGGAVYLNASVLNRPEANQFYSLSTSVNAATTHSIGTITADALTSGQLLGAAFNILDMLYEANDYLRTEVGACSFSGCRSVTTSNPIPKVSAYWEKGFNPNDYFGSSSGLSFYLPGYSRLFILGGVDGDVDSSDTDHFDNSVIIHEYGHFLEDNLSVSDSPGGSHNGNKVIDPRLAWSEGWGNFFQAAVLGAPKYYDSAGNIDGTPDLYFAVDLENYSGSGGGIDQPSAQGEGNFREFSVTRALWDAIDSTIPNETNNGGTDGISGKFPEIWASFTKTVKGYNDSTYAFRNIGLLHFFQQSLSGASDWTGIRTVNYQDGDTSRYAQYVSTAGSCSPITVSGHPNSSGFNYTIDPTMTASSLSTSNLFYDNRFFHVKITSAGTYTFQLTYHDEDEASTLADLDLYLYRQDYTFGSSGDMAGKSIASPTGGVTQTQTETITVALQPGNYLLNVNAYTGSGVSTMGPTNFTIKINGSNLCPASL